MRVTDVDYRLTECTEELAQQAETPYDTVVISFEGVDFVDSFGLGVLIGALKRVRMLDGDLRLVVAEPRVRRVFEVCDLDRVFTLHRSVDDALAVGSEAP